MALSYTNEKPTTTPHTHTQMCSTQNNIHMKVQKVHSPWPKQKKKKAGYKRIKYIEQNRQTVVA